ncbi:HET-domain-containing protein [Lepidopterella palustris CBS 459.81]|uniref:HET-domain-containing protein n=1 Tax=Lepidopterella palustris CBS 459.81 TaxID=1314670 RepID=A0A8E2E795_9PEZI|nr:HET-domain-containing protein [Lepidopterella palustris CBS 459.81]
MKRITNSPPISCVALLITNLCLTRPIAAARNVVIYFAAANRELPSYFALLRAWLERCNKDHKCKGAITNNSSLPTRVIDIGEASSDLLILRDSNEIDACSYVALSHCWGKPQPGDKQRICTHKGNWEERKVGFQVQDLPKTFQDAVEVTRQLGKRYLWIDSLCIVQSLEEGEGTEDWELESKRMEIVFSSAYCTLAASSAEGSHEGFLKQRPSSQPLQIRTEDGDRLYVSKEVDNFVEDMRDAPLNTRGWVLQERILSRRTIHFGAKQTYFECGEGVYCENFTHMKSPQRKEYFSMDPQFPDRLLKAGRIRTLEFIQGLFRDFSQRHLTNATDRAVAFSGLESRIAKAIDSKSIYGIPERLIHQSLLWQRPEHGKDLSFEGNQENALSAAEVANFMDCELKGEGTTDEISKERAGETEILKKGGGKIGWIRYDIMEDIPEFDVQRCIVVGRDWKTYYVLVVNPSSLKDEYTRIGTGAIDCSYLSRIDGKVRVV